MPKKSNKEPQVYTRPLGFKGETWADFVARTLWWVLNAQTREGFRTARAYVDKALELGASVPIITQYTYSPQYIGAGK